MENERAVKALLGTYRRLPKVASSIERELSRGALRSAATYGNEQVYALCERLTELTSQKARCVNMKVLTDKATAMLSPRQRGILWYKHIACESFDGLAKRLQMHESKLQREYSAAIKSLAFYMMALGYDADRILTEFSSVQAFGAEYDRVVRQETAMQRA